MPFSEYWGWYTVVDSLSNNDITKWEYISNLPLMEFLNLLSFYKDKQKYLEDQKLLHG